MCIEFYFSKWFVNYGLEKFSSNFKVVGFLMILTSSLANQTFFVHLKGQNDIVCGQTFPFWIKTFYPWPCGHANRRATFGHATIHDNHVIILYKIRRYQSIGHSLQETRVN